MVASLPRSAPQSLGAIASAQRRYAQHRPEESLLYQIVVQHSKAFFAHLAEHESPLPSFVREDLEAQGPRQILRSGRLEEGFVRVVCTGCRHEHLVAFSCNFRGFCPLCGARAMPRLDS